MRLALTTKSIASIFACLLGLNMAVAQESADVDTQTPEEFWESASMVEEFWAAEDVQTRELPSPQGPFEFSMMQLGAIAGPLQSFTPRDFDSKRCQSTSDLGCTAHHVDCITSPSNYVFLKESLQLYAPPPAGLGQHWCRKAYPPENVVTVEFRSPSDVVVPVQQPQKICVEAHAESGAGVENIGRTAFQNCTLSGQWFQYR